MQLLFGTGQKVVSFPDPPPCSVEGGSGDETRQKVDVPLLSLSCLGAKYTTQSLWETLVGLLLKLKY